LSEAVATYPLPQQTVYLTPKAELRFIYGQSEGTVVRLGEHVGFRRDSLLRRNE